MPIQSLCTTGDNFTVVDILRRHALLTPERIAYTFLRDGETDEVHLTYAELDEQARAVAARLQEIDGCGKNVLLFYPSGLEFIAAFFGCLYAGAVAVPMYATKPQRASSRLRTTISDAQPVIGLTTSQYVGPLAELGVVDPVMREVNWLSTDAFSYAEAALRWSEEAVTGEMLALVQYTSGSTGSPKGVMISHRNLLHNGEIMRRACRQTGHSVFVCWLPLYHDMGLIGNVIQSVLLGGRCVFMSPMMFIQKPLRWLKAIERYRGTFSGGPNFAYELCVSKITLEQRAALDLGCWEVAFNGAEPVRYDTVTAFTNVFATSGFREDTFYPCYGLAEATLFVAGAPARERPASCLVSAPSLEEGRIVHAPAGAQNARRLVSCGEPPADQTVAIVDPESGLRSSPGRVGEIWVAGQNVAQGYWNLPEETARTFHAYLNGAGEGPFLRTGDLGFLEDGRLFITGRLKDLIIIRGSNHYPQDIELSVERCHPSLRPNGSAAFSVEVGNEERLVVVAEVERRFDPAGSAALTKLVQQSVAQNHQLLAHAVLVKAGTIPRTTSGKVRRDGCRARFLSGDLEPLISSQSDFNIAAYIPQGTVAPATPRA